MVPLLVGDAAGWRHRTHVGHARIVTTPFTHRESDGCHGSHGTGRMWADHASRPGAASSITGYETSRGEKEGFLIAAGLANL
jgi:hypothetical protein